MRSRELQDGACTMLITDPQHRPLAGVTSTMSGPVERTELSDSAGKCNFYPLPPATYSGHWALEGYSTLDQPGIVIEVGRTTSLEIILSPAILDTNQ
ncbi:MAG: carboxypeptidase-like regulatory domain-containing protein [Polyangiaceae bacterium]